MNLDDIQIQARPVPSTRELLDMIQALQDRVNVLEAGSVKANRVGPHVRGSSTSRQAALANYPRSGSQRHRILEFLEGRGGLGATRQEIARHLGLSDDSVRPRVVELIEGRWVLATDRTRPTPMGEQAEVLVAADRELRVEQARQDVSPSPVVSDASGWTAPAADALDVGGTLPGASETIGPRCALFDEDTVA